MQTAGANCNVCGRRIVLSKEGKCCVHCGTIVHLACEARPNCHLCGQPYQGYEPPKPDPKSEAFVPWALRPARSGGPVLLLATGLALLFGLLCYCINHALHHGQLFAALDREQPVLFVRVGSSLAAAPGQ